MPLNEQQDERPHFPALDAIEFTPEEEAALDAIWGIREPSEASSDGSGTDE